MVHVARQPCKVSPWVVHAVKDRAQRVVSTVQSVVGTGRVGLHEPIISENDRLAVDNCLRSGFVSSVGEWVTRFEGALADYTGARFAVAMSSGTSALQIAIQAVGVQPGDEVLVPSLSFVATANAITHAGAIPHFVDISRKTLGLDPLALDVYLDQIAEKAETTPLNKTTGRRISAIVPMHCFGHPVEMESLLSVSRRWGVPVVEDAAEALGSFRGANHMGTLGVSGVFSFNGNKIVTSGGGGAIVTNDEQIAKYARHVSTTAKIAHPWEFDHDQVGYNYRMPNLNAALGWSQLQELGNRVEKKRLLAERYKEAFADFDDVGVFIEPDGARSNYWLNAIILGEQTEAFRDDILSIAHDSELYLRPAWRLLHQLKPYENHPRAPLAMSESIQRRIVNLPSSSHLILQ